MPHPAATPGDVECRRHAKSSYRQSRWFGTTPYAGLRLKYPVTRVITNLSTRIGWPRYLPYLPNAVDV